MRLYNMDHLHICEMEMDQRGVFWRRSSHCACCGIQLMKCYERVGCQKKD